MKNRIITISREFSSGGRTIGKKVAEKLGIAGIDLSVPALSLLEGQKRPVSNVELNPLADILNVSVDWLLGRE